MSLLDDARDLADTVSRHLQSITTDETLTEYRGDILWKNGDLTKLMKGIKDLSDSEKRTIGKDVNIVKDRIIEAFETRREAIAIASIERSIREEYEDMSIPYPHMRGTHVHPLTRVRREVEDVFVRMGFSVRESDEITTEYANFDAVNIPATHPARDMQDTFWLSDTGYVLATQTSCMQNTILRDTPIPIRTIIPGRVFRNEAVDATHENTFYQVEGIVVDRGIHLGHLKYCLQTMLSEIFQKHIDIRMRPGFFPFVEPGVELDSSCPFCDGKWCRICKHSWWIELVPAGMIHPNVLREWGVDPEIYSGFAFGLGLNRLAMLKYAIDHIRLFMEPDIRFLSQF